MDKNKDKTSKLLINMVYFGLSGAQERTRTSTSIQTLAPEASASTNSATWANTTVVHVAIAICGVNAFLRGFLTYLHLAQRR